MMANKNQARQSLVAPRHGRWMVSRNSYHPEASPMLDLKLRLTIPGSYTFNIPACIPNGDYLLRIQSLGIHNPWPAGVPQFYISCAQISVSGGGSVTPSQTALIPGAFKETDPGYTANVRICCINLGAEPQWLTDALSRSTLPTLPATPFPDRPSSAAVPRAATPEMVAEIQLPQQRPWRRRPPRLLSLLQHHQAVRLPSTLSAVVRAGRGALFAPQDQPAKRLMNGTRNVCEKGS